MNILGIPWTEKQNDTYQIFKSQRTGLEPKMSACKRTSHICNIQESTTRSIVDFLYDKRRHSLFSYVIPSGVGGVGHLDQ